MLGAFRCSHAELRIEGIDIGKENVLAMFDLSLLGLLLQPKGSQVEIDW